AERMVAELRNSGEPTQELFSRLQLLALEVAAAALFSLDIRAEGPAFREAMQRYANGIGRPMLLDFLTPRGWPTPRSRARHRFRRAWMRRTDRRGEHRDPIGDGLFGMLASSGTSRRRLVEQSATMLTAGHE